MQSAFQIDVKDNVATALEALEPGDVRVLGDAEKEMLLCTQAVPVGHKIAARDIAAGEMIVKYGVVIGRATADIAAGSWVHLHVMCSNYDERSSHLDVLTGAPRDIVYE